MREMALLLVREAKVHRQAVGGRSGSRTARARVGAGQHGGEGDDGAEDNGDREDSAVHHRHLGHEEHRLEHVDEGLHERTCAEERVGGPSARVCVGVRVGVRVGVSGVSGVSCRAPTGYPEGWNTSRVSSHGWGASSDPPEVLQLTRGGV